MVFDLTRLSCHMIYHTQGKHANHYTTNVGQPFEKIWFKLYDEKHKCLILSIILNYYFMFFREIENSYI